MAHQKLTEADGYALGYSQIIVRDRAIAAGGSYEAPPCYAGTALAARVRVTATEPAKTPAPRGFGGPARRMSI
jgi:hypothetical protein